MASVWTATARGRCGWRSGSRAGQVFVNNYGAGGGVELPFGGVGQSGHGREKGFEALYGFSSAEDGGDEVRLTGRSARRAFFLVETLPGGPGA